MGEDVGYDMSTVDEGTYFRLNIWGMGRCREYMYRIGMAVDSEWPVFPEPTEFGFKDWDTYYEAQERAEQDGAKPNKNLIRFDEANARARREHGSEMPGFPLHKVASNDGMIVTPDEIHAALEVYDRWTENEETLAALVKLIEVDDKEWWDDWIVYMRVAETEGGISVY